MSEDNEEQRLGTAEDVEMIKQRDKALHLMMAARIGGPKEVPFGS